MENSDNNYIGNKTAKTFSIFTMYLVLIFMFLNHLINKNPISKILLYPHIRDEAWVKKFKIGVHGIGQILSK